MRTMPAAATQDSFAVIQHVFNQHLSHGKWSVHIDTLTGRGRFFGPQRNEGTIEVIGKSLRRSSCWPPRQVIEALETAGYDCADVVIS